MVRNNHPIPDRRFHSAFAVVCVEGDKDLEEGRMMNDNRKVILSHQEISKGHTATTLCHLYETIEQKNTYITALEAELAELKAQRDAWKTMAIALEQKPGRLKTVEHMLDGAYQYHEFLDVDESEEDNGTLPT